MCFTVSMFYVRVREGNELFAKSGAPIPFFFIIIIANISVCEHIPL